MNDYKDYYNPSELTGFKILNLSPKKLILSESELRENVKDLPKNIKKNIPEGIFKEGDTNFSVEVKRFPDLIVRREGKISRREPECCPKGNSKFGKYRTGKIRHPLARIVWEAVGKASDYIVENFKISEHKLVFIFPDNISEKIIRRTIKMSVHETSLAIQSGLTKVKKVRIYFGVMNSKDFEKD